ncbi:MAG: hypothetical protein IJU76_14145 [Desulfovibrionaceae bacterium]|nr:hypothetical protein [Desulfovibrionaceae bacterium]
MLSLLKIPFGMINRAKTFDGLRAVFTMFIPEDDINNAPLHVEIEDDKKKAKGIETSIYYPGSSDAGRYEVWEVSDVIASHTHVGGTNFKINELYPEGVQERHYEQDENEALKVVRNASMLNPQFLITDNPDSVNGPPVVTDSGVVLGGNSRTMSLTLVYQEHPDKAEAYKTCLQDNAEKFGLNKGDIAVFKRPILVRVVNTSFDDNDMAKMSRHYNQSFTQGMDEVADGISRAKFISRGTFDIINEALGSGDFPTIRSFLDSPKSAPFINSLKDDGVIEESKVAIYLSKDKKSLTQQGKMLIEAVLRGTCIDDYDILSQAPKGIIGKIDKSLSNLAFLKTSGKKWDISQKLKNAIQLCTEYKKQKENGKVSIESFLNRAEGDLLSSMTNGEERSYRSVLNDLRKDAVTRDLFLLLEKCTINQVTSVISTYTGTARRFPEDMGSLVPPPDPVQHLHKLIESAINKKNKSSITESAGNEKDLHSLLIDMFGISEISELKGLFVKIFGAKPKGSGSLYEQLVKGVFDYQKPISFLRTLEMTYKEIEPNLAKLKPPFKKWVEIHEDWILS